ncbi:hypothetical protein [Halioxenophilus sp. WMMB6]|uniref:hypothetical protein n=1 Tax=Halioxenophilus sp. WMMB6 TaxID=3073815 RepID=UPI00295EBC24|nr:hypothetical protein [Halioxenophilus sp. WMMB6]
MSFTPDTPTDEAASCATSAQDAWLDQWQAITQTHFAEARSRTDQVYKTHFASAKAVALRHWQNRADIPKDLLNLPRSVWRLAQRALWRGHRQANPKVPTGKELALLAIIAEELLALSQLQTKYQHHLSLHPDLSSALFEELEGELGQLSAEQAQHNLQLAVERLRLSQEGSRDLLMFVSIGLLGRGLADKITFGSAAATGSALASSVYISQQSLLGGLWAGWFGAPAWVGMTGAVGGFGLVLLATPLISPLTELGVNRLRAKRLLARIVERTEAELNQPRLDLASTAGQLATYLQLLPDLLQVLKQLR